MQAETYPPGLDHATALPARYYVGEAMLAMEQRAVFARSWQLVAHQGQLAEPGDYVVEQVGHVPVIVVRGQDGVLRGFVNVCRHRAGPLALCNGKGARALHCKYHGWTYTLEGQLRSAPEMQGAADFDVSDIRLPPIRVHEWQGLVFVALDEAVPPFGEVYGGIAERIAPIDLSAMRYLRRDSYEIDCNWKVYVDNFLEGYHLPHVHPGLSKVLDYRAYDTELFDWYSLQSSPLRNSTAIYGDGEAFYYFVYPNVMLNIMPGRLQTNRIVPLGPDRCRVEFDYYYAQDDAAQARIAADQEFSDEVQQEDIDICVAVQRGLTSGTYEAGRLCPRRESGVWHFHNQLRAAYAAAGEHA
ncbi:aromatic ring-hydroxylating oxygenase subunit alpha [Dyella lutea]|uniref:Aromatic ring-hydroxylating dioxygenase subunit alpha n=1 Tax=Dyella lutea TaxID=2950441 RepID=A0ABT1FB76_9GAMM|nr:aromatic ring-hydroxylating dioxygenase subunit alpha [Dyella lutea]MCP1374633.1 aromatic ring-hydroxylating dioxygenase subunit alpha [Dyella lutea]